MKRRICSAVLNAVFAAAVAAAWFWMFFGLSDSGRLSTVNWAIMKYFTILSNMLEGAAALLTAVFLLRGRMPGWLERLRHAAVTGVTLTMATVLVFLGPVYGYAEMFSGANLYLHLLIPLGAIADFLFLDREKLPRRSVRSAMIPVLLYGVWYIFSNLTWGAEWDFYLLIRGSALRGALSLTAMALAAAGIAALLWLPHRERGACNAGKSVL